MAAEVEVRATMLAIKAGWAKAVEESRKERKDHTVVIVTITISHQLASPLGSFFGQLGEW